MSTTYVNIQASYDLTSDHTPRTPMSHTPRKPTRKSSTRHKDSYITNSLEYIINKTALLNRNIGINPGQNLRVDHIAASLVNSPISPKGAKRQSLIHRGRIAQLELSKRKPIEDIIQESFVLCLSLCYAIVFMLFCCYYVVLLLYCSVIVLSYVLIVFTVPLPPGVNPIAVDKYIYLQECMLHVAARGVQRCVLWLWS